MLILILAALLWLALLFFTLRALKRNRRPSLRVCRKLEPRRYRPAGRRGRCLRYHWQGEAADALGAHTAAMQTEPLPPVHRKKGVSTFGVVMGVNAVLAVLVVALLVRGGVPKPGSGENTASSSASLTSLIAALISASVRLPFPFRPLKTFCSFSDNPSNAIGLFLQFIYNIFDLL